jgi:hypothetical protein
MEPEDALALPSQGTNSGPSESTVEKTQFLLDGFSWNLIFVYFSKIDRENPSFIIIW